MENVSKVGDGGVPGAEITYPVLPCPPTAGVRRERPATAPPSSCDELTAPQER